MYQSQRHHAVVVPSIYNYPLFFLNPTIAFAHLERERMIPFCFVDCRQLAFNLETAHPPLLITKPNKKEKKSLGLYYQFFADFGHVALVRTVRVSVLFHFAARGGLESTK